VIIGDGSPACTSNATTGPVTLTNNTGAVELVGNSVTGPVKVTGNTGSITDIAKNSILGPLSCSANAPPPTNGGSGNVVSGPRSGQCAGL